MSQEQAPKGTPLTVEALLDALKRHDCRGTAGYNGTCESVVLYRGLVAALESLTPPRPRQRRNINGCKP